MLERWPNWNLHVAKCKKRYFMGKGVKLLDMVISAIRNNIPYDYLLVDSWLSIPNLLGYASQPIGIKIKRYVKLYFYTHNGILFARNNILIWQIEM